jgi:hypothetical protein
MTTNERAGDGQVFVCACCGKRSKDRYGDEAIDTGWDESCMLHAVLCHDERGEDGSWVAVTGGSDD